MRDPEGGSSPVVQIQLFGGVRATADDGTPLDVGPAKCQTVLAVLALSAGAPVPVSRLVELVWASAPPRTADKTVQSYVLRLRQGLGREAVVRIGAAYGLSVAAGAVDVTRFRRQLGLGDIDAALAEWTGRPLAGLDAPGLDPMVDALVEQWLGAVETALESRLETDPQATIGPLTELTAEHPFREGLWSVLMTALYRVGRQADALAAFQAARRHLVEGLGVEPGPRLRNLESRVLDQDEQLRGRVPSGSGPGRPSGTVTFGFCEIEDSSRLWEVHRAKMAAALARLDTLVRASVGRHGGYVFTTGGESFGAAFHRADDAAGWATELQLEVSSEPWPGGVEPKLRIGLHTGEAEERAESYFGPAVNAAARMAAAGHGGQTLVSGMTSDLLAGRKLHHLGTYRLDGEAAGRRILQLGDGEHAPLHADDVRRGNLPRRPGRLIGRESDVDGIAEALARSPVVTLLGPGGIGKTRLALAAARRSDVHPGGGAWLVELATVTSSGDVPRVVADALEVQETAGCTLTQSIVAFLQVAAPLVVLDNCEHVLDGAAEVAAAIAEGCSGARVLATSREALGLADEQLILVLPLDPAGSGAELFTERARAVSSTFDPHAHRGDVEEICRRVDGLPLAIELAAARTRTLTAPELVERLGNRLRLLTGGRRTGAERQRTLRATIAWSYDLLTRHQQALLQRLSVFAGPFDLDAAEQVAGDDELGSADVDDLLQDLVERSMLAVESGPFGRRFRLLETVREFAAEELGPDLSSSVVAERHARWCLGQVARVHELLVGPGEIDGVARLGQLWPDLRAAVDRAVRGGDRELAGALLRPVATEVNLRRQTEISEWGERILAITPRDDADRIVYWLACATYRYMQVGDHAGYEALVHRYGEADHALIRFTRASFHDDGEQLLDCSPEAVSWLREQGEEHAAALTEIAGVGAGLLSTGQFEELDGFVSALAERYRTHGPPTLHYVTLSMLGHSASFQGRLDRAEQLFEEATRVDVPDRTISVNPPVEARAAFRRGQRSRALRILRAHVVDLLATGYTDNVTLAAAEFVSMMAAMDRLPHAACVLGYLSRAGDLGTRTVRTVVSEGARTAGPDPAGRQLDAREALEYMRDVLRELTEDHPIPD